MTDQPPTNPGDVWVVGQRMQPNGLFPPSPGGGGGSPGDDGGIHQNELDPDNPGPDPSPPHPCDNPETALEWNTDAAAAEAKNEFERRAAERTPPETLNTREWSAALFQMPDGRVVTGNMTSSVYTFQSPGPGGRASVGVDWTAPERGVLIGMVHSHNAGSHLPSGSSPTSDDQDSLRYIRDVRSQLGLNPDHARIYIVALTTGPANSSQYARINVYNHRNQQAAISGTEGPEVNPEAQPCS